MNQTAVSASATAKGDPFVLVSLSKSKAPDGASGRDWYAYVIAQGRNTIEGRRQGSRSSVTEAVEVIVEQLNERRAGKAGRTHLTTVSRKREK